MKAKNLFRALFSVSTVTIGALISLPTQASLTKSDSVSKESLLSPKQRLQYLEMTIGLSIDWQDELQVDAFRLFLMELSDTKEIPFSHNEIEDLFLDYKIEL